MKITRAQVSKILVHGFWSVAVTWLFFCPVAAFHYFVRFGLTGYLVLDGESPALGDFTWGTYQVHLYWGRLGLAILLWAVSLLGVFRWLRYVDSKA